MLAPGIRGCPWTNREARAVIPHAREANRVISHAREAKRVISHAREANRVIRTSGASVGIHAGGRAACVGTAIGGSWTPKEPSATLRVPSATLSSCPQLSAAVRNFPRPVRNFQPPSATLRVPSATFRGRPQLSAVDPQLSAAVRNFTRPSATPRRRCATFRRPSATFSLRPQLSASRPQLSAAVRNSPRASATMRQRFATPGDPRRLGPVRKSVREMVLDTTEQPEDSAEAARNLGNPVPSVADQPEESGSLLDDPLPRAPASTRGDGQRQSPQRALGAFLGLVCQSGYGVPGLPAYSWLQLP